MVMKEMIKMVQVMRSLKENSKEDPRLERCADVGKLDDYQSISKLREIGLDNKADFLKKGYQKLHDDLITAINKLPSVPQNIELTRFVNSYNIPKVGSTVILNRLDSFTKTPSDKMMNQFGGSDRLIYKVLGGHDFVDISKVGKAFTYEDEVLLRQTEKFKVEKILGKSHNIVYLVRF